MFFTKRRKNRSAKDGHKDYERHAGGYGFFVARIVESHHTGGGMKKFASILRLDFVPASTDLGLLVLRLWLGLSLLLLHGWTKLSTFQQMAGKFPDPLKIGHQNSLILAIVGEVFCPILIVLG